MLRYALPLLLIAAPALAADEPPHTGVAGHRSMPEWSDFALFAVAVGGIWFVRSRLRRRFRKAED